MKWHGAVVGLKTRALRSEVGGAFHDLTLPPFIPSSFLFFPSSLPSFLSVVSLEVNGDNS